MLAEDDVLLREGLASLLERSDYEVVGRAVMGLDVRWICSGTVRASATC